MFKTIFFRSTLVFFLLKVYTLHCQNYTYRTHLNDDEIEGTIKHSFTEDTIRKYIGQFRDRLGYQYYLYQSVLKYRENKPEAISYLDKAFARGLDTLCVPELVKQMFGDSIVNRSHSVNYLKDYDLKLIQQLDSLYHEDQKYRRLVFVEGQRKPISDSLTKIWKLTDASNVLFLKNLIKKHGYPTASKVGYRFCAFGYLTKPELIIQHLGAEEREFQISLLNQVMELCLKNEESWDKISGLQFNLHFRFCGSYSEFTSLYFIKNKLDVENSLFSLYEMAKFLRTPFKTMHIKCNSELLFGEVKRNILAINHSLPIPPNVEELAKFGFVPSKRVHESQIVFEMDKSLPKDKVYYKIIDK